MGLHPTKNFLLNNGNFPQNKMATYGMNQNVCKSFIRHGLISKIYNGLIKFNSDKKPNLIKKWGEELNKMFLRLTQK